ncbi:MAG: hypothetical protein WD232_06255 [Acidimicrobiales bacterium]
MERTAVVDRPEAEHSGDEPVAPPWRRAGRTVLALVVGLVLGLTAALLVPRLADRDGTADTPGVGAGRTLAEERTAAADAAGDAGPAPAGAGATTAEEAVTGFLDAEVERDLGISFGFLSADERRLYGSPAGWVGQHADVLGPVLAYEVLEVRAAEIVTDVRFEAGLDQVTGLTPGAAKITWTAVEADDGTWGVDLDESVIEPVFPTDDGAAAAARRWADARRACETPGNERSALVGSPALADRLCNAAEVGLSDVEPVAAADAQPIFRSYGPTAANASRVVRVSGPVELGVVLVPIGETWTVIAVVP